ncbi:MAG: glycosyltransferase [Paramuribaculum sp.]|nr:glycosyltransferase [Paramuribaculum sp.]
MIYSQLYSWQFTPLTITLLAIAALAAIVLLVTIIPALNLIIRKSDEDSADTELDEKEGISVIVSTGFHTDLLKEFIENLYAQNFSAPIEVIIVNTGGEEYTEDTIRMLQADYPDIKNTFVPSQSRNLSRRKLAITLGIKAASHPVILLTSANAVPAGSDWLASIMHHFRKGADIVIASTVMQNRKTGESVGAIRSFDSMKSALRRVPEAMKGKPVGADSSNLAYRKSLFFDNKGVCETLNLN